MTKSYCLLALLIGSLFLIAACGRGRVSEKTAVSQDAMRENALVEKAWFSHEQTIETALKGGRVSEHEYLNACLFFERLTGIQLRGNGSYVGWLPNEHTEEDLMRVREWYAKNRLRLYWDEQTRNVKLRSGARASADGKGNYETKPERK